MLFYTGPTMFCLVTAWVFGFTNTCCGVSPQLKFTQNDLDKFWKEYKFNEEAPQIKSHYSPEDVTSDNENQSTGQ